MISDEVREKLIDVINVKYFELTRFCDSEQLECEAVVYSKDDCIAITKHNLDFFSNLEYTEDEIQEYVNYNQIHVHEGSVLLFNDRHNIIFEVIDLLQSDIKITDPREYFEEVLDFKYARNNHHFRIIKAPNFKKFVDIKREEKHLEQYIPSASNTQKTLIKF